DLARAALGDRLFRALEGLEAAETDADEAARFVTLRFVELEVGVGERVMSRRHRELGEAVHLFELLFLDEAGGCPGLHLAGDTYAEILGIELRDAGDPTLPSEQGPPR